MTVAPTAVVRPDVSFGEGAMVEDFVRIGGPPAATTIGEGALIRSGTVIYGGVAIGRNLRTGHHAVIRAGSRIGDDVIIGSLSIVDGDAQIGNSVSIQSNVYIPPGTVIGDYCFLGPCCVLTNDRAMASHVRGITPSDRPLVGPQIGAGARIGANATILPGVTVGDEAVVGAGAVVTKDIPRGQIAVGNPARVVGAVRLEEYHPMNRRRS